MRFCAGEHQVALVITEPTVLEGAGREHTLLTGTLLVRAHLIIKGMTLGMRVHVLDGELEDVEVAGCVVDGTVVARDCVFRGSPGPGLIVNGQLDLKNWLAERNRGHGIEVFGQALLEGGVSVGNGGDGIRFHGAGEAYGNLCQANLGHGVAVVGEGMPAIEHNTLRGNGGAGIACLDRSGGRIHANVCEGYLYQGPLARPMWGRNEGAVVKGVTSPSPSRRSRSSGR